MKKNLYIFGLSCLLISSCFFCHNKDFPDDDFYNDLASQNNRIWGDLSLDVFDDNLETLTYDYYINYLDENKVFSTKDLVENIKKADNYYFDATKETFVIVLQYDKQRVIVGDEASSVKPDTILTWTEGSIPPALPDIAGLIIN